MPRIICRVAAMPLYPIHAALLLNFVMAHRGEATDLQAALSLSSSLLAPTEAFYLQIPEITAFLPLVAMEYCPPKYDLLE